MNSQETNGRDAITISSSFPSVPDWDQPFTEQELEAIDAIESSFRSQSTSSITPLPSVFKSPQDNGQQDSAKNRRQLPSSVLGLSKPLSLFPCRDHQRMRYPPMKFRGRICYSRTEMEVEKAARELLQSINARKEEMGQVSVGFDIEWKPTFRKGPLTSLFWNSVMLLSLLNSCKLMDLLVAVELCFGGACMNEYIMDVKYEKGRILPVFKDTQGHHTVGFGKGLHACSLTHCFYKEVVSIPSMFMSLASIPGSLSLAFYFATFSML